jgi:tetratricopeptide (TPR) repeat protein
VQPVRMTTAQRQAYTHGRSCFERGNVDAALASFENLVQSNDQMADVHYMMGVLYDLRGDSDPATESLRQALRINPSYTEAMLALATVYERAGDFDRSEDLAERAQGLSRGGAGTLDPMTRGKLANLQAKVAAAYAEAGQLREAIDGYRKALDLCPTFHDIRHRLAAVLRDAGLPSQALAEYHRVLRANPSFLEAKVQLGLTYYTLGRAPDAAKLWREVLKDEPMQRDARMYLRLIGEKTDPTLG